VLAGNWVSSVSQAASAATAVVREAPKPATPPASDRPGVPAPPGSHAPASGTTKPTPKSVRLKLSKVKMAPRRFAVSHKRPAKGTRLDGSRVTFSVTLTAKVRLIVQRRTSGRHPRWVSAGTITRSVKAGSGEVRLTGRFGNRLLKPRAYRLSVSAARSEQPRTAAKRIAFRVVKG
jgi:hypothetical protein